MFRIAEEYTNTIKNNPDETYFFILEKIDFQNFKIFKKKFREKSEKSKFQLKCDLTSIFQKSMLNEISIEISIFEILSQNFGF